MTKWSAVTPNGSPSLADYLMGVTSGNVDDRVTIQNLVNLILKTKLLLNDYKFSAYRNAALNQASNAVVIYDTKLLDTSTNYNAATGLFTAPIAGFYQFNAAVQIASNASFVFNIGLQKNGSGTLLIGNYFNGTTNSQGLLVSSPPIQLAAGDTIGVIFGSNNGGNTTLNVGSTNTWFGGFLISAT